MPLLVRQSLVAALTIVSRPLVGGEGPRCSVLPVAATLTKAAPGASPTGAIASEPSSVGARLAVKASAVCVTMISIGTVVEMGCGVALSVTRGVR
ncbi:hypothetical protein ACPPVO_01965 [Dactylosporangium sp. McL0621]|uniref:hypothetical protein n=1 Tax=Dactylosporangium sp. McL0621 TaxID=3415678 RepID=UPI003CEC59EB